MFGSFQASGSENTSDAAKPPKPPVTRRITTSNACGSVDSIKNLTHKVLMAQQDLAGEEKYAVMAPRLAASQADACQYSKPPPRVVLSKKLVEDLSSSVEQYRSVFERVFPGRSVEQLVSLSKEDLISIIGILPEACEHPTKTSELASPVSTLESEGADSLETLIQAPEQDPVADEATRHSARVQGISDDVNGLSLSLDKPSSYVGVSSITAALKVICRVAPATRRLLASGQTETAFPSRADSPSSDHINLDPGYLPPAELGQILIETYFSKVHPLMPMLDEQQFWQTWLYGERKDHAWLALLNTVLALGSVMSSDCTNAAHEAYYQRAMRLLDLDSLGSGNMLVVQALGLLSGYYLHYVSRPNLANNLMGATLRQATVLGLHREYTDTNSTDGSPTHKAMSADVRRRTWWSLYVLDTWANTTTGRPSLGQPSKGITVHVPEITDFSDPAMIKFIPLAHNVAFCKIAAQIQDALSATPLLPFAELNRLDKELLQWHTDLPPVLRCGTSFAPENRRQKSSNQARTREMLETSSIVMLWKYQNLRLLLHRPYVLATALRDGNETPLSAEEKVGVGRCQAVAARTITDISNLCREDLLSGWNGVWFMYQAVMVPLVCIFASLGKLQKQPGDDQENVQSTDLDTNIAGESPGHSDGRSMEEWRSLVEKALQFFVRMDRWSAAAKKSHDVVSRLYEASKILASEGADHRLLAQGRNTGVNDNTLDLGVDADDRITRTDISEHTQLPIPGSEMMTEDIWGLSPNGAAAMNNFWFDDMMWDVPVDDTDIFGNAGTGFAYSEFDWMAGSSTQGPGDQHWHFQQ